MKYSETIIILNFLLFAHLTIGQLPIDNGKYFYHRENITSNYFDEPNYAIDSVILFYDRTGDTLTYWTISMSQAYAKTKFEELKQQKEFGKYLQEGLTLSDGRIIMHHLRPKKFLIRNDSLFQWHELYKITEDSIQALKRASEKLKSVEERLKLVDIIDQNTQYGFILIFSPDLFEDGTEQHFVLDKRSLCPYKINLINKWVIDGKDFYRFQITDKCGFWGHEWGFTVSDNFEFETIGGYGTKKSILLTDENRVMRKQK